MPPFTACVVQTPSYPYGTVKIYAQKCLQSSAE